jgi:hypothetical protein
VATLERENNKEKEKEKEVHLAPGVEQNSPRLSGPQSEGHGAGLLSLGARKLLKEGEKEEEKEEKEEGEKEKEEEEVKKDKNVLTSTASGRVKLTEPLAPLW